MVNKNPVILAKTTSRPTTTYIISFKVKSSILIEEFFIEIFAFMEKNYEIFQQKLKSLINANKIMLITDK